MMSTIPLHLPSGLEAYSRSPDFTPDTLPAKFREFHTTKVGVWGVIHVIEGALRYRLEAPHVGEVVANAAPTFDASLAEAARVAAPVAATVAASGRVRPERIEVVLSSDRRREHSPELRARLPAAADRQAGFRGAPSRRPARAARVGHNGTTAAVHVPDHRQAVRGGRPAGLIRLTHYGQKRMISRPSQSRTG